MKTIPIIAATLSLVTLGVLALQPRYITVDRVKSPVYVARGNSNYTARNGARLLEGDSVFLPARSDARLTLDISQGYMLLVSPTQFKIDRLRRAGCGAQTRIVLYTGKIYNGLRKFTCRASVFEIVDLRRSMVIRHEGTDFLVAAAGDRMVSGVSTGTVFATSAGVTERVPSGYGVTMTPTTPPYVEKTDYALECDRVKITQLAFNRLRVSGETHALNTVAVNGVSAVGEVSKDKKLQWSQDIHRPREGLVTVVVSNSLNVSRVHQYRNSVN